MRQHVSHVDLAPFKISRGDQSVLVAAYVEDNQPADPIRTRQVSPHVGEVPLPRFAGEFEPRSQRPLGIAVLLPELPQAFAREHVHDAIVFASFEVVKAAPIILPITRSTEPQDDFLGPLGVDLDRTEVKLTV